MFYTETETAPAHRMESLEYLRSEIKIYFPESKELQLSSAYDGQRRFNFYFKIAKEQRHLLYLNWDGDGDRFTLKCLEFPNAPTLGELCAAYTEKGSKMFNMGQPIATLSFIYRESDRLSVTGYKGNRNPESPEISGRQLMYCVNPFE